jgi:SAM-dependent methyltransferase
MRLSEDELRSLYSKDYFFGEEYSNYVDDKVVLQKNFRLRLRALSPFLDPARHKTLLEVGSAFGFFLELAGNRFDAFGIDISEHAVRDARDRLGVSCVSGDLLTHDLGDQRFDVVCMWDTIEHLPHPQRVLERLAEHTEAGALLAITTGDIGSVVARFKGPSWRLIHPPTHLHYFTRKSLRTALDAAGFEVVHQSYCGFHRSVDNIAYNIFALRRGRPAVYNWVKNTRLGGLTCYLNLYDIMLCIGKRR